MPAWPPTSRSSAPPPFPGPSWSRPARPGSEAHPESRERCGRSSASCQFPTATCTQSPRLPGLRRSRRFAVHFPHNAGRHFIHRPVAINRYHPAKLLVVIRHRLGLAFVGCQTLADDFLAVIISDEQLGIVYVTDFINQRRLGMDVVDPPTGRTSPASSDPEQQLIIIHLNTYHNRQPRQPLP